MTPPLPTNLSAIADGLVSNLVALPHDLIEGRVRSRRPKYRRVDCDGRALVYVIVRPRFGRVRVELGPHWVIRTGSSLVQSDRSGGPVLSLEAIEQVPEAVAILQATIEATRTAFDRESALRQKRSLARTVAKKAMRKSSPPNIDRIPALEPSISRTDRSEA